MDLKQLKPFIKLALKEDIGKGDITSDNIIPKKQQATAAIISKDEGIICGLDIAEYIFKLADKKIKVTKHFKDGDRVKKKDILLEAEGSARALLHTERTILNMIHHLAGIATFTRQFVDAVQGYNIKILDTRKTLPGMRIMAKYAVTCGGGTNHRIGLYDMVLIKDNHIAVAGSVDEAVRRVRKKIRPGIKIEVECETLAQVKESVEAGVDWIMLDNMSFDEMEEGVKMVDKKAVAEASGNVNMQTIVEIAKTGVDCVSIGALTHSVKAFDISMDIKIDGGYKNG